MSESLSEMRQRSLNFRRLSSNLLQSTREDVDVNLARFGKFIENDSYINELAQKSRKSQVKTSHEFAKEIPFIKPANKFSKKLNQKHVHCSHLLKPSAGTYCLWSSVL